MRVSRAVLGLGIGLFLHTVLGWWVPVGFAQPPTNTTFSTSTSSSTSFESPPNCSPLGSSEIEQTVTLEFQIGPGCMAIGNRDVPNPSSCSTGPGAFTGTLLTVPAGTENFNTNTHTETIQCVAAVPVIPWPLIVGSGGVLLGFSAWRLRRQRKERR